ncbi:MAG: FAD-dependent oxidoreductase [Succinivibrionaceae bacterium]|nr:FAD-dependent oxidoreductase [Succinivibrionaceae bacterium]
MQGSVTDCDVAVIGAGAAGLEAFRAAEAEGARCVLIEAGPLGATAQLRGGVPLSILQRAAHAAHALGELPEMGIIVDPALRLDCRGALKALRTARARVTNELLSPLYRIGGDRLLTGSATFIDDHHLSIGGGRVVAFRSAVIATGSTPYVPYALRGIHGLLTPDLLFDLEELPRSVAIFGSGAMGLQLGQALSSLGVGVVVHGDDRLWRLTDEEIIDTARERFGRDFPLLLSSELTGVEEGPGGLGIYCLEGDGRESYQRVDRVISASGRLPGTVGLGLEAAGVECAGQGFIAVDPATLATTCPHVFAAGDVLNRPMSLRRAKHDGALAGRNAARFPSPQPEAPLVELGMILTNPELAVVGLTLGEMRERGRHGQAFIVGGAAMGAERGVAGEGEIKIYVDAGSHRLMGAEMCGQGASHAAQFLALAMGGNLTVEALLAFPFYSPLPEAALREAAGSAARQLR